VKKQKNGITRKEKQNKIHAVTTKQTNKQNWGQKITKLFLRAGEGGQ
jgi:hypothetical protein